MLVLGIDTATSVCSVALADENKIIGEYSLNIKKTHSQRLMPLIQGLVRDSGLLKEDIEGIAVACGPGSFTGIRIGTVTAKSLAQALKVPVAGIPTLDILAAQFPYFNGLICPVLDARREEVYTAVYRSPAAVLERITEYRAVPLSELLDFLLEREEKRIIFLGDGLKRYGEIINRTLGDRVLEPPLSLRVNRAALTVQLGLEKFKRNENLKSYLTLQPFYLRRPEAEVKWEKRQKEVDTVEAERSSD